MPHGISPQEVEGLQLEQDQAEELGKQQHIQVLAAILQPRVPNPTESTSPAPAKPQPKDPKPIKLQVVQSDRYDYGEGGGREDLQHALVVAATPQPKVLTCASGIPCARTSGTVV